MREAFEHGGVNLQIFFGNKGWEPEASHIKKQFKDMHDCEAKKGGCCGLDVAQQEGDKMCCPNLTAEDKMHL